MDVRNRRGQAEIIGTLILIAASALLTTLMLFWGLSLQGQSNTNYAQALARTNSQAAEQLSIDSVLFLKTTSGCTDPVGHCYAPIIYVRNFGSQPIRIAGINFQVLASGFVGLHCEVSTSTTASASNQPTILARSVHNVSIVQTLLVATGTSLMTSLGTTNTPSVPSTASPGCSTSSLSSWTGYQAGQYAGFLPSSWNGQTVSIQVATSAGTQFSANFAIPP